MSLGKEIRNLLLVVLAIVIVVVLWNALWSLAGLALFLILVYVVYLFLKGRL